MIKKYNMKKITTTLLIAIGFKVSALCTFDVYIREHKSFDGSQATMTFGTGGELNDKFKVDSYKDDKLYGYHLIDGNTKWYEISTPNDCSPIAYENCINKMSSMVDAVGLDSVKFKIIVYK